MKRNNGRKRIDPQNATVFLSLDTENLGQVDSLISVNKRMSASILGLKKMNHRLYQRKLYSAL